MRALPRISILLTGFVIFAGTSDTSAQVNQPANQYEANFILSGFLLRSFAVCSDGKQNIVELAARIIASKEVKVIASTYPKTTEKWMTSGADTFNSVVMKDGIQTACGPALTFFRERAERLIQLQSRASQKHPDISIAPSKPQAQTPLHRSTTIENDPYAIVVDISISVKSTNPLAMTGSTNLPDETQVAFWILWGEDQNRPPPCMPHCALSGYANVKNGRLDIVPKIPGGGKLIPHSWNLKLFVLPNAVGQPSRVTSLLGQKGEHLRGPYVMAYVNQKYIPATFPWNPVSGSEEYAAGLWIQYSRTLQIRPNGDAYITP